MNPRDAEKMIRGWLAEQEMGVADLPDSRTHYHLKVSATAPDAIAEEGLHIVHVVQSQQEKDRIVVFCGVDFAPEMVGRMKDLPQAAEVLRDLERHLDFRPEAYVVDDTGGVLKKILVFEEIFFDGLTKDRLMRALRSTSKTMVQAFWILDPLLAELRGGGVMSLESRVSPTGPKGTIIAPSSEDDATVRCPSCGTLVGAGLKCSSCGHGLAP